MAYANTRLGYHHPQADSALGTKRTAFVDDDDSAVLDPSILESDMMQSPNEIAYRKDSFANSNGVLSPAESHGWEPHYAGTLSVEPVPVGAPNAYHDDAALYPPQINSQPPAYPQQPPGWAYDDGSGHATPTTGVEFVAPPPQYEGSIYVPQRPDNAHTGYNQAPAHPPQHFQVPHGEPSFLPAPQVQTPMSPHSHQDWMGMAQQEMESRPSHKRMRLASPPRALIDYRSRDGIRKKNGRIDIPQERNISTIDDLISSTTDEDFLKELKQQKRLLRNREAALASRQRKKRHTEDLEHKEKTYSSQINNLQSRASDLAIERDQRDHECHVLAQRLEQCQRHIEAMENDKRELIVKHNEETSSLRRKVRALADQLEAGTAPVMSAAPSSTGFTDFNAEMEALSMGAHDWDNFIFVNELAHDPQDEFSFGSNAEPTKQSPILQKNPSTTTLVPNPTKRNGDHVADAPYASGLLFMLLLCGAFVASRPASAQSPDMPKMPADVRAAAPTVLNSLLSEANRPTEMGRSGGVSRLNQEPAPSGLPLPATRPDRLDRVHRTLTSPTRQQEIEHAFSLTTTEYASMTNMDIPIYNNGPAASHGEMAAQPRRNLAEALASLEQDPTRTNSKADVYTRSLLWDQIPADVVKQFKEIVRDHHEIEAREQQRPRPANHDYEGYKIEP